MSDTAKVITLIGMTACFLIFVKQLILVLPPATCDSYWVGFKSDKPMVIKVIITTYDSTSRETGVSIIDQNDKEIATYVIPAIESKEHHNEMYRTAVEFSAASKLNTCTGYNAKFYSYDFR